MIREVEVWLRLDGRVRQRLFCLPANLEDLSLGHWASRGLATSAAEVTMKAKAFVVSAKSLGRLESRDATSDLTVAESQVIDFVEALDRESLLFRKTGGTHVVAVFCGSRALFVEDVSRHCAIDKVFGQSMREKMDLRRSVLVTSCRQTASTVLKAVNMRVPVIVTVSAPTDLAVAEADQSGITLVGFARGHRFNVYTHEPRIVRTPR